MPDSEQDYKIPLKWILSEQIYWVKRKLEYTSRSILYSILPNWLVREVFMYAQRYIADDEVVPEVQFMTVFGRVCDNKVVSGTRVTE